MNLLEFCEKYKISLAKGRKMFRDNRLRLDENTSENVLLMIAALRNGDNLSALQLCELAESASLVLELGRYAEKAQDQLDAIGQAKGEAAPLDIVAHIGEAARSDPAALETLVSWLQSVIPAKPVPHSYVAARLLLGLPANVRKFDANRISRALMKCRECASFEGWHYAKVINGRNVTFYQRPGKKPFDL